jgi:glycosyltransferase involved in cell wall biosynthesis
VWRRFEQALLAGGAPVLDFERLPPGVADVAAPEVRPCGPFVNVGFVGPADEAHGADMFLRAAQELLAEGLPVRFTLVGDLARPSRNGPSLSLLFAGLPRVEFAGVPPDAEAYHARLAAMDVVCFPTALVRRAGCGRADALLHGKPVAEVGELRELVRDADLRTRRGREARRLYEAGAKREHFASRAEAYLDELARRRQRRGEAA